MFDTDNLHDEQMISLKRRRLFGNWPLSDQVIDYTVYSPSKGAIYFMCGASKIFKLYARLTEHPHTIFTHCIVGIKGSEHLVKSAVRALDAIDHIAERQAERLFCYSQVVIHTKKGQCFILCQDPPQLKSGHVKLQLEETDKYPPKDAVPLEDFALELPAVRHKNAS